MELGKFSEDFKPFIISKQQGGKGEESPGLFTKCCPKNNTE